MKTNILFACLLFVLLASSCSNTLQMGRYVDNSNTHRVLGTSLELNCDSTFVRRSQGDMMDHRSYGKWSVSGDSLILSYDTIAYGEQRYSGTEYYIYKYRKLEDPESKENLKKLKKMLDTMSVEIRKDIYKQMRGRSRSYLKLVEKKKCRCNGFTKVMLEAVKRSKQSL